MASTNETWAGIRDALERGLRGLSGRSSLAKLLAEHRSVRNIKNLRLLTIQQILTWADAHKEVTGEWPGKDTGAITGSDETWAGINYALKHGARSFPGGSTLAKLLAQHRNVRHIKDLSPLTIKQILGWADAHKKRTGEWPKQSSGQVTGTDEMWGAINATLGKGLRGLQGHSSLATLLAEYRSVRNIHDLSPLTIQQILEWADEHKTATEAWPNHKSGQVTCTDETWGGINAALSLGIRGFPGGSTLAKLLADHRSVRNIMDLPPLTFKQILVWADAHKAAMGDWPSANSGLVTGTNETWAGIAHAIRLGYRTLPGGSSLAVMFAEHRGVRNRKDLPLLTINQILAWADEHKATTGDWPKQKSGQVSETSETWLGIDAALRRGARSLPKSSSLAKLLAEYRSVRNTGNLPPLTIKQILALMDAHKKRTGKWPGKESGVITGTGETWAGINAALGKGLRGLPSGTSLAKLLDRPSED